jgi:predicted lipoprotein
MKGKTRIIIITLASLLLAGLVAFSGCSKKPTPAKPAAKAVEPNKPK